MRWIAVMLAAGLAIAAGAAAARAQDRAVTLADDGAAFTLDNGVIAARIDKRSGTFSVKRGELRLIERGYWSQVGRSSVGEIGRFGTKASSAVRIDPAANGGERAEVACRFGYDGKSAGLPCDVEMRYAVARGNAVVYACAIWSHPAGYPSFSVGEGRMALKLNGDVFDYLAIDERRHGVMPSGRDWDQGEQLNMKEVRRIKTGPFAGRIEHKYDYSAILADTPAYGWASTTRGVGVWLINPSIEYLAGGPTKVELTGHLDVNAGGAPTLLNMWHGSHYGGSSLVVGRDESWSKVIGPFVLYCNAGADVESMGKDATARAWNERGAWPYSWENDPQYPPASGRGAVTGKLTVSDPLEPNLKVRNLQVGLASAPYEVPGGRGGVNGVDWQRDSKHYQFWTRANQDGSFKISAVRPGTYTLYAFADGVLGDFSQGNVTVAAGQTMDVGPLTWTPQRFGRTLWEIGVPDRSADEFRHGEDYWHWGLYYEYAKEFPQDVNFVIGRSDARRDWNYAQPAHVEGRAGGTTWTVSFDLPEAPRSGSRATLRLAICGNRTRGGIAVGVNGQVAGNTGNLPDAGVMHRDGIRGYWFERDVGFDGAMLKAGANKLSLSVSGNSWVEGVLYDYVRLELKETP
jgi:rhamnogalacturonan endolyase